MAGLSQGGGVGLALAAWMTAGDAGDSGMDIWAWTSPGTATTRRSAYTNAKVQENYRRRFQITFPNEELPAARPLLTTPIHDRLTAANAVWGATLGLEHALWFQEAGLEPKEDVTFRRSNAWDCVAGEVAAVRERVGMTEISNYAKYRVTGPGAEAWLSSLLTARMPRAGPDHPDRDAQRGRAGSSASSRSRGRPRPTSTTCSARSPAEVHHSRWFRHHLPADGSVTFEVLGLALVGLSIAGPQSRDVLSAVAPDLDLSTAAFPFMTFRRVELGMIPALVGRINYSGELGYELWVAPEYQRALFDRIMAAGEPHGIRLFGMRALMSLRLEKSYGTWYPRVPPDLHARTRRDHALHQARPRVHRPGGVRGGGRDRRPERRLVALVVEPDPDEPADVIGDEPIWHDGAVVGWVTSGGYGHHVKESIALGYVPAALATPDGPAATASRSRSSAGAGRPGSSPSRCSTRRASGCASDRGHAGGARRRGRRGGRIVVDGRPVAFEPGDSVAIAILRAGEVPGRGGTLCLAGDCGNCLAEVDGIAYVRTCQTAARPGTAGRAASGRGDAAAPRGGRHGPDRDAAAGDDRAAPSRGGRRGHRRRLERAGRGRRGGAAGKTSCVLDAASRRGGRGDLRRADGRRPDADTACSTSMPREIVVATGAAEIQPVCPGQRLAGIVTARAAERLHAAGVDLGGWSRSGRHRPGCRARVRGRLVRFEGDAPVASAPS